MKIPNWATDPLIKPDGAGYLPPGTFTTTTTKTKHSKAHFPVIARLDMASKMQKGTVTIDRTTDLMSVRPYHRKKSLLFALVVRCGVVSKTCDLI